jgi:hypothetical protein
MENLFRLFFGLPSKNDGFDLRREDFNEKYPANLNDDGDDEDDSRDDFAFAFNVFKPDDIIKQFEGIFAGMDAMAQSLEHGEFPALGPAPESPFERNSNSPRDQMLKDEMKSSQSGDKSKNAFGSDKRGEPTHDNSWSKMWQMWQNDDGSKASTQDTDLDSVVKSQGLDSILPSGRHKPKTQEDGDGGSILQRFTGVKPFSYSSTFSSTTYSYNNGKSESRQTTKDAEGNVVTHITRSVDGETWTETVKKDPSGNIIESHSDRLSSDSVPSITDKEKADFDSRWNEKSSSSSDDQTRNDMLVQPEAKSDFNSIFRNLFGFSIPRNS